jgi:hypothetical protein
LKALAAHANLPTNGDHEFRSQRRVLRCRPIVFGVENNLSHASGRAIDEDELADRASD